MQKISNENGTYFLYPCLKPENKKGTIIFIHGFATTSEYHNIFIKSINNKFDYIAIQLPGAGYQEWKSDKKPTVDDMFDYCFKLINSLKLSNFFLLGHSMGGGLALRLANVFTKETKGLILSTPMNSKIPFYKIKNYFLFNPKNFKKAFKLVHVLYHDFSNTFNNDQEKMEKHIKNELDYQIKHRDFFIKLKKSMFSIHNLKVGRKNEANLNVPTLVIAGKYDSIIPLRSLVRAFDRGKNKDKDFISFEIMNSSSHIPFQEQEYEYCRRIKEFISSIK